ncbi:MAG: phage portal protein [Marinomonas sp.]|uniref:phage portal protein n=1 Tax=Sphingomonadales TaxID=204457 RepID=UPI0032672247
MAAYFGISQTALPSVNTETAMQVPAVWAAVTFLSSTLANLPLHVYKNTKDGPEKQSGGLSAILNQAPNEETTSYAWRKYFWTQVFTGGRGISYIERTSTAPVAVWNADPTKVKISRKANKTTYEIDQTPRMAKDIIDLPFLLKSDMLSSYGPIVSGQKVIQLALAMNEYGSQFFAGGGVPPLAVTGPMPAGKGARERAQQEIYESVKAARDSNIPIANMPPGYELKPIGFDPAKGQMTEARRFQIEEVARLFNLPPVFLQDLTHGTFSNTEQQDLHLVKHVIAQWAKAFEQELNLKLFGQKSNVRYVEHNLDGLQRGDFKTRMDGLAQGVQSGLITPNEARSLDNRQAMDGGEQLFIQGATVPLATQEGVTPKTDQGVTDE